MTTKTMNATHAIRSHSSHELLSRMRIRRRRLFDPRSTLAGRWPAACDAVVRYLTARTKLQHPVRPRAVFSGQLIVNRQWLWRAYKRRRRSRMMRDCKRLTWSFCPFDSSAR